MRRRMSRGAAVGAIALSLAVAAPAFAEGSESSTLPPDQPRDGSISIVPGGTGSGHIESQPAGIDCTITNGNGAGTCTAFFPAGSVVQLAVTPVADSIYRGFRGTPGCHDPTQITVFADTTIYCQPGLPLKF